jgi:hypothetical protein
MLSTVVEMDGDSIRQVVMVADESVSGSASIRW